MVEIVQLKPNIGAEVRGFDIADGGDDRDVETLKQALHTHEILVFRDQDIDADQQMAFAGKFGSLSIHPFSPNLPDKPELIYAVDHRRDGCGVLVMHGNPADIRPVPEVSDEVGIIPADVKQPE